MDAKSIPCWALPQKKDAQGSDLACAFGDLNQREKLSEIKPPLNTANTAQWSQTLSS